MARWLHLMLTRSVFEPGARAVGFFLAVTVGTIILAEVARRVRTNRLFNRQNTVVIGVVVLSVLGSGAVGILRHRIPVDRVWHGGGLSGRGRASALCFAPGDCGPIRCPGFWRIWMAPFVRGWSFSPC